MSDYLPPVVARLSMDYGDFAAGIAKARALMKGLEGDLRIKTDGLDAAVTKVTALKKSLGDLTGTVKIGTDGLGTLAAKTTAATGIMVGGWRLTATALHWVIAGGAELAAVVIPAAIALGAALAVASQGAQMVQQHMQALRTAASADSQMFGTTAGSVIGLKNSLQQAQDAANPSVYGVLGSAIITVNEHFGGLAQTGLQVVQMFQTFSARVATDFAPGGSLGGAVSHLTSNMVPALQGLGQVLGNTAHAVVNFANAMPGLADHLLSILAGVTGLASKLTGLAGPLILVVMGFEEFNRWGGLVATTLTRLGVASASLTGGAFSLERFAGVVRGLLSIGPQAFYALSAGMARFATAMGTLSMAAGEGKIASFFGSIGIGAASASGSLGGFAAKLSDTISKIGPFQAALIVAAAVGLGVLIDKAVTARTAVQQLTDSMQKSVMAMSNLSAQGGAIKNISLLSQQLDAANVSAKNVFQSEAKAGQSFRAVGIDAANAQIKVSQLHAGLSQQQQDLINVSQGAQYLAKTYGTTFVGALALADLANVKLASGIMGTSQAAMVARMQIASLVQGYQAMGQSSGQVGADMTALAIQSGLAATNVSQLNQAWDQFQGNLTGGTAALAGLSQDLTSLSTGVNNVTNVLGKAKSVSLSMQTFASDLKSFAGNGAQAWQNFSKVVGSSAPQMIDWLRTAGAEGALSATQFKQAGLDMASALVPLATQSKTAQAEILGLVQQFDPAIQTFSQLKAAISGSGASFGGLGSIVSGATQKMANMQSVAQTLGNVLNTALVSALQAAQVQASGAGAAMQKYSQDLMSSGTSASQTHGDYLNLMSDLEKLGLSAQQAAQLIASVTTNLNNIPSHKTSTVDVYTNYITTTSGSGLAPSSGTGVRAPGHAAGTPSAPAGWAWVGEAGPELVKFRGGEQVLPNQVSTGFANGTGGFGEQHIHVYLDGKQIYSGMQKQATATQRRTGHNGLNKRTR